MKDDDSTGLYELADLIHGVGRQLPLPNDLQPGPCTPVEITVMRYVHRNPGTSARAAAKATLLPSSNFSRVVRGLEAKGLVRREADLRDARGVRLHPTDLAEQNMKRLHDVWSRSLEGILEDVDIVKALNAALRQIEAKLVERRNAGETDLL